MDEVRATLVTIAALGLSIAAPGQGMAQEKPPAEQPSGETAKLEEMMEHASVRLRVDGMSCPFCAYGLEKRLREIPEIEDLVIRVSDGLVLIKVRSGRVLEDDAIAAAVDRAGFTLREVARVKG